MVKLTVQVRRLNNSGASQTAVCKTPLQILSVFDYLYYQKLIDSAVTWTGGRVIISLNSCQTVL